MVGDMDGWSDHERTSVVFENSTSVMTLLLVT